MAAVLLFELRACLCHRCAVVLGTQPITRSNTRASTIPSCDQLMTQSTQRQNKASFKMDPAQGPESSVFIGQLYFRRYVLFIFSILALQLSGRCQGLQHKYIEGRLDP